MRRDFIGALLFAFMLPGCAPDQPSPSAFQGLDSRAATPEQAQPTPTNCEKFAALPGQGREYNLFANLTGARRGCAEPSPVTYQKIDASPAPSDGHPVPSDGHAGPSDGHAAPSDGHPTPSPQEELDRAACKSEGERAAKAASGLQPGEYDIVKNIIAAQSRDAEKIEQSCMSQRGYKSVAN
jgi:hypothetical protein